MELRIISSSVAVSIYGTGFGANLVSGAYLLIRHSRSSSPQVLGLANVLSLGTKSGTIIGSHLDTHWISVNPAKYPWICNPAKLTGKTVQLTFNGTVFIQGKTDIVISVIEENGEHRTVFSKWDIATQGVELGKTSVRAKLKLVGGTKLTCSD